MSARDELAQLLDDSVLTHTGRSVGDISSGRVAGDLLAAGWRPPARTVSTVEERGALPAGVVVCAASGTIACRHHSGVGVVFGDERPFPWHALTLPLTILHDGGV